MKFINAYTGRGRERKREKKSGRVRQSSSKDPLKFQVNETLT